MKVNNLIFLKKIIDAIYMLLSIIKLFYEILNYEKSINSIKIKVSELLKNIK